MFTSTAYETQHSVVLVHLQTGERNLVLGHFVQKILGVSSADLVHLIAILQAHVTRLDNTVRWRWAVGDVAIWDNRATQHSGVDDFGLQRRTLRRVTVAGDIPVGVDRRRSVTSRKRQLAVNSVQTRT
jgi:taurine dioxygenase